MFCLFDLILYVTSKIFQLYRADLPGLNQYLARINVLAQGHNAVTPVRLEPATLGLDCQSRTCPLIFRIGRRSMTRVPAAKENFDTINERRSKSLEKEFSIAICRPTGEKMAIENTVSSDF